mmetsp:Transcript_20388/g.33872  ORF Transcript_20388/g.33872 Transcript_20388/m.33872 type:complete len:214 (+) Transcript_20388:211-852(+)
MMSLLWQCILMGGAEKDGNGLPSAHDRCAFLLPKLPGRRRRPRLPEASPNLPQSPAYFAACPYPSLNCTGRSVVSLARSNYWVATLPGAIIEVSFNCVPHRLAGWAQVQSGGHHICYYYCTWSLPHLPRPVIGRMGSSSKEVATSARSSPVRPVNRLGGADTVATHSTSISRLSISPASISRFSCRVLAWSSRPTVTTARERRGTVPASQTPS